MSLYEYEMKMQAFNLARVDKEYDMHMQAWLNYQVTATKEQGKKQVPIYKKFEDFFNYEKQLREVEKPKRRLNIKSRHMAQIAKHVNAGRG